MKYIVRGTTTVYVEVIVEAENEDAAIEKAENQLDSLTTFVGNGGTDKLIGVYGENKSIYDSGLIHYSEAEIIESEN